MKFAFVVHPLSEESKALFQMDDGGELLSRWRGLTGCAGGVYFLQEDLVGGVPLHRVGAALPSESHGVVAGAEVERKGGSRPCRAA